MSNPRKRRKLRKATVFIPLVLLILAGAGFFYVKSNLEAVGTSTDNVVFEILKGETLDQIDQGLLDAGLIKSTMVFGYYAKATKLTDFKAGLYNLNPSMDVKTILTILNDASAAISKDVIITIIPGDWAKGIALKLAEKCINVTAEEMLALWNDEAYIRSLMPEYSVLTEDIFKDGTNVLLEGYLMPETYYMNPEASADSLTRRILNQTQKVYDENRAAFDAFSMSVHDIITLASVVQFEARTDADMRMVSQVFLNRLAIDMPLQSSVTVCYALYEYDDWRDCETFDNQKIDSPYNTYLYNGLPIGPITNPSKQSILATLEPTANDYYYFIADVDGDGKMYYAATYADHLKNVEKYLK